MAEAWIDRATERLEVALAQAADGTTKAHWERYLKGAAFFRGVPMADTRSALKRVWRSEALGERSMDELFSLTDRWFSAPMSEDKLAAVLLLAEPAAPLIERRHVDSLAEPLASRKIQDWNVCDWYCTKALHAFIAADVANRGPPIAAWGRANGLWQRRAGVVAFAKLAARATEQPGGFVEMVLEACEGNLVSDERFAQTGPGWVLRELSKSAPNTVAEFVDAHPELSPEARRMATARLRPGPYRRR